MFVFKILILKGNVHMCSYAKKNITGKTQKYARDS